MKRAILFLLMVTLAGALLSLTGCITPSADSRLVGTYDGTNSESLTILPDTRLLYTHVVNEQAQRGLVGYLDTASSSSPNFYRIFAPDTSPYLGTTLKVSDDFQTLTVHWEMFRDLANKPTQTRFLRKTGG